MPNLRLLVQLSLANPLLPLLFLINPQLRLVEACEKHEPELLPPSAKTFYAEIKRRSGAEQTEKREGRRAAIQKRPSFVDYLELTTPRHGDRPFEIVHFDHTELDLELGLFRIRGENRIIGYFW